MANRLNALVVVLEKDIREDDAQALISAIQQLRGVLKVKKNVSSMEDAIAETRARQDIATRLWNALGEGR